jgi:hypothetical protein
MWVWRPPYILDVGWYRRDREQTKKGLAHPDTLKPGGCAVRLKAVTDSQATAPQSVQKGPSQRSRIQLSEQVLLVAKNTSI